MSVGMIWAQDRGGILGSGSGMLWHVPADFKFFKSRTLGHPLIMGRASWEALGAVPLPRRVNIVLTRDRAYRAPGALLAHSLDEGLRLARGSAGGELVWIAGGGDVYRQGLKHADFVVISELDLDVSTRCADPVYAPALPADWRLAEDESETAWREQSGDARWRVRTYRRA